MNEKWMSYRVVHSRGGIRLVNEYGPPVKILPISKNGKIATFEIPTYAALLDSSKQINVPVIGVEFYSYADQFEGKDIPEWRSYCKTSKNVWSNEEGVQLWSDIGTGAHKAKNGRLWDLGSRISQQLRVSAWRLKELSNSYNYQLLSIIDENGFCHEKKFMNGFTWLCYMSIQSFLVDVCILRDYLSEYAANFVFENLAGTKLPNITTLSGLRKHMLNKGKLEDPLFIELQQITENDGWLKMLSAYRDLVIHSAPLAHAEKKLYAISRTISIPDGELPAICCPIPRNPHGISTARSNGSMFKDFEEQWNKYVGLTLDEGTHIDGLDYCHEVLGYMSELANNLASRSPVKPQMVVIDKSNIIGDIKITRR